MTRTPSHGPQPSAPQDDVRLAKTQRGKKLRQALLRELHRRGVSPVKGAVRNAIYSHVARKVRAEDDGDTVGVRSWARSAADAVLHEVPR